MNIYKGLKKIVIWFGVKLNFGSLFSRSSRSSSVTFSEYASQMVEASYLSAGEVLKELDSSFLGLSEEKILTMSNEEIMENFMHCRKNNNILDEISNIIDEKQLTEKLQFIDCIWVIYGLYI